MEKTPFPAIIERRKSVIEKRLRLLAKNRSPRSVYDPIRYVLGAGGKRLRAVLTLLAAEAVGGNIASALDPAIAIELLHNFTLVHDDIMDNSDLRRCRPTVHKKWNTNVAILSGDQLAAAAYEELLRSKGVHIVELTRLFTKAFTAVCEGQGYDKEFEDRNDVAVSDYLMMIDKKTAAVISAAAGLGAIAGGGTRQHVRSLIRYGTHLGHAFQLQDDVLDIAGDEHEFGKRIVTDILEGKRTFLLLTAFARTSGGDRKLVNAVLNRQSADPGLVPKMKALYHRCGALDAAHTIIENESKKATRALGSLPPSSARASLEWLARELRSRRV